MPPLSPILFLNNKNEFNYSNITTLNATPSNQRL